MLRRTMTLVVMLMAVTLVGCTWTQKWMAGGAAVGATVGGIWAGTAAGESVTIAQGALIGAAAGAAGGALIGSGFDYADMNKLKAQLTDAEAERDRLAAENSSLKSDLQNCQSELAKAKDKIRDLEAQIARLNEELRKCKGVKEEVSIAADVLFQPGSARLTDKGRQALDELASKIVSNNKGDYIQIEGHTDSDPIKVSSWKSNWELGSARSLAVLHYLVGKGVDAAKCSAVTFGEYQNVAGNDSKDGKAQNRRAVIAIYTGLPRATTK